MAQKIIVKSTKLHQFTQDPVGNTGITSNPSTSQLSFEPGRLRANIELSPSVSLCLDHICEVTGSTRSQLINSALLEALPGLLDRADSFAKRGRELFQSQAAKKK